MLREGLTCEFTIPSLTQMALGCSTDKMEKRAVDLGLLGQGAVKCSQSPLGSNSPSLDWV